MSSSKVSSGHESRALGFVGGNVGRGSVNSTNRIGLLSVTETAVTGCLERSLSDTQLLLWDLGMDELVVPLRRCSPGGSKTYSTGANLPIGTMYAHWLSSTNKKEQSLLPGQALDDEQLRWAEKEVSTYGQTELNPINRTMSATHRRGKMEGILLQVKSSKRVPMKLIKQLSPLNIGSFLLLLKTAMDFKIFKSMIFHGSLGRRVLLRAFMLAAALSIVPLLQMISGADPDILYTLSTSAGCGIGPGSSSSNMFPGNFLFSKVWGSFGSVECEQNMNLTTSVVKELMGKQMLNHTAKALCVGEGSMSAVMALRDLGFSDVTGVYRHPFFSLKHKRFVYELDYVDNSYDFVVSTDLDKVSAPAILVLEIERVLKPGGIGSMLVGPSGLDSTSLIRSATPVSSLLKASTVVHVDYVDNFTLIVFKKKLENTSFFEQYRLPADCPSMANTKDILDNIEPLLEDKPVGFGRGVAYLPKFVNISDKQRLVYIDIGAGEHLNSNVTDWFLPSYPVDRKAFDVYFVDHNTSVMPSYVNKEDEGFDFLLWVKETVQHADFVVLRMNAGAVELKMLSDLFESGTICFIDELFLHCSDRIENGGVVKGDCMDLFKALRRTGVYVHQWWGD
ncbi:hypothetical protein V6N13_137368 [Hibiscus sabdariffa]